MHQGEESAERRHETRAGDSAQTQHNRCTQPKPETLRGIFDHAGEFGSLHLATNVKLVHPLPAWAEDELGVKVQGRIDVANTTAGSGLHEATCWASGIHY